MATTVADARVRARRVKLLAMDIDGVLTDGALIYGSAGNGSEIEIKVFDVRDGLGITLARLGGLKIGWVTARRSTAVERRARELQVDALMQGVRDKAGALRAMAADSGLELAETAYMGDDLYDLPPMRITGLALAPADAVASVRKTAHRVTAARGGRGAVREVVEFVLRAQGILKQTETAFVEALASGEPPAGGQ